MVDEHSGFAELLDRDTLRLVGDEFVELLGAGRIRVIRPCGFAPAATFVVRGPPPGAHLNSRNMRESFEVIVHEDACRFRGRTERKEIGRLLDNTTVARRLWTDALAQGAGQMTPAFSIFQVLDEPITYARKLARAAAESPAPAWLRGSDEILADLGSNRSVVVEVIGIEPTSYSDPNNLPVQ